MGVSITACASTEPGHTNPGQVAPQTKEPCIGQTFDRFSGQIQTLDSTNPGQVKPWTGSNLGQVQTWTCTNPGQVSFQRIFILKGIHFIGGQSFIVLCYLKSANFLVSFTQSNNVYP